MEAKAILILAAIIALVGFGFYQYRSAFNNGKQAGMEQVQTAWDEARLAEQKVTAAAIAQATKERDDALSNNEGISNDLQAQLLAARSLNTALTDSLRKYQAGHPSGTVPKAGGGQGTLADAIAPGVGSLDDSLGNALDECYTTRVRYEALIKQITPQL